MYQGSYEVVVLVMERLWKELGKPGNTTFDFARAAQQAIKERDGVWD